MNFLYGVLDENYNVINIIEADNPDASIPLKMLIPDAHDIILSTEEVGTPCIGGDLFNNIFRDPPPYPSWIWNNNSWEAPVPYPQDNILYIWDEDQTNWVAADI